MKKLVILLVTLFYSFSLYAQVEPHDLNGDGYRNILSLEHLRWVSQNSSCWGDNFKLEEDIDAKETQLWYFLPIGNKYNPFTGVFNGNHHIIKNLYINTPGADYVGLFGYAVGDSCEILNICLENCDITGNEFVGSIVAYSNCLLSNCYSTGAVYGNLNVGGIVGVNGNKILNSYSMVEVIANKYVGGLVGLNYPSGTILNSYSTSKVHGNKSFGGLIGKNNYGDVLNSFWNIITSEQSKSDGGLGINSSQMKSRKTFTDVGWDFNTIWNIDSLINNGYPFIDEREFIYTQGLEPKDINNNGYKNIFTLAHLRWISENDSSWSWSFELDNDINAGETQYWNYGIGFSPIGKNIEHSFSGNFNGNGYIIDSLYINRPNNNNIGFFGYVWLYPNEIKNLGIENCNITGCNYVGSLVGSIRYGAILSNSYSSGKVNGQDKVGGLIGYSNNYCRFNNCYSRSTVNAKGKLIGGLIGLSVKTVLSNSYSKGLVVGKICVGGLIGLSYQGSINNCYSHCNTYGKDSIGGLIGLAEGGRVYRCYSKGGAYGLNYIVGGLISIENDCLIEDSFWNIQKSGTQKSAGGKSKTTIEMKTKSTFIDADWNFDFIWKIDDGYPYIKIDTTYQPRDTDNDGYINISKITDLLWMSENCIDWFRSYELDNDINAEETKNWNSGKGFSPIGYDQNNGFSGKFEGKGYSIKNLYINRPNQSNIGMFGYLNGSISNLGITDCDITGLSNVGGLVGDIYVAHINNSYSTGNIQGQLTVGGLIGSTYYGEIFNCYSMCNVTGKRKVGGIIGYSYGMVGYKSYSIGKVQGNEEVGGIMGFINSGYLTSSFWDIETSGIDTSQVGIGKTTSQMKRKSTFTDVGWDFSKIWDINPLKNFGYPYFILSSVDIQEKMLIKKNSISLFPNPIQLGKRLHIVLDNTLITYSIKIYNIEGDFIAEYHNDSTIQITDNFIIGVYILVVESKGKILASKKFVII